jgi:hypothetical protein
MKLFQLSVTIEVDEDVEVTDDLIVNLLSTMENEACRANFSIYDTEAEEL